MQSSRPVYPVVLSGGAGSRLWPLSRESYPKQLLALTGARTLLQEAALRGTESALFNELIVVANADHRFIIAEQLREIGVNGARIVLEPAARDTAAAVTVAALLVVREDLEGLILVMPADHHVADRLAFHSAVEAGMDAARSGSLVLFGIHPDAPATAYGYIQQGSSGGADLVRPVAAFKEKPDRQTAEAYWQSGEYLWNSGIFLLPAKVFLDEVERYEPDVLRGARDALEASTQDMDFLRLDGAGFARSPSISIDHAVLERTARAAVVPASFQWTDVGSWSSLWELAEQDGDGNVLLGDVLAENTQGSYVRTEGPLITTVGVTDLIVVATSDAVLVAHKGADQAVKTALERLRAQNHPAATQSRRVHRPWGWYEGVHTGERFQVKRITVNPGEQLSLQRHFHRAEHWVVVAGTARVTVDQDEKLLTEDQSVYIPLGAVHRLSNPGKVPLSLIEVQSGAYLGEDDIVRLEDVYSRA